MSRMVKHLISASLLAIPASAFAANTPENPEIVWRSGIGDPSSATMQAADPTGGAVPAALQRWRMLSQSGQYSFSEYASFLMSYPDWPNTDEMRKNAEQAINVLSWSPNQVVAYFDKLEPVTNGGRAKFALALAATGDKARAIQWGRRAWREGSLSDDDENRIFQLMSGNLTSTDYDIRVSRLLWSNSTRGAQRWLPYASEQRKPVLEAQLAHELKAPDAAAKFAALGQTGMSDAGLLMERVSALRASGNSWAARELLANRPTLVSPPHVARDWLKVLLTNAEAAEADGQFELAYRIASKLSDAFPAGTDITKLDLSTRDTYTSLAWLAGEAAYYKLNRPREAIEMFNFYTAGARTPQTRAKGLYWAGRAAKKSGDPQAAQRYLTEAARYYDFFHGQLALESLGRPLPAVPAAPQLPQLAANMVPASYNAARMSSSFPGWRDSNSFMRALSNSAKTESDFKNLFAWSNLIGRPDLSVIAARSARIEGHDALIRLGYPTISVPPEHAGNWTFIHAIARQESQFDRNAVSHAGARGLMQLMPGTARETSGKIALAYRPEALNSDITYNVQLGSTYFQRMLSYYNGSYPLAVAAYNAGPGNVNKWLARNGDPRSGGIDILDWIEQIPIFETRNYVQRVLENAVMYDHLYPEKARYRTNTPLSNYLGRRVAG